MGGLVIADGAEKLLGGGGADSAGKSAMARRGEAEAAYNEVKGITNRATTMGIMNMERDLASADKNLARQEALIGQIDPTIIEASQQALKLLRGETSSTLAPLQRQRETARQKLVNQLREQLGPGAETSTAGIQALNRFDSESTNLFAGAQQQALGQLGQTAGQFNSTRPDLFREIAGRSQIGQIGSNLLMGQAGILGNARQGLIDTAGANFVEDQIRAQQRRNFGEKMLGVGIGAASAYATGGATAAAPKSSSGGGGGDYAGSYNYDPNRMPS